MLRHPCILEDPQRQARQAKNQLWSPTKGIKIRSSCLTHAFSEAKGGRKCYVTRAFSLLWGTSTATFKYARPELAPLSALGHINNHIQITTAQTSPFICFGAHAAKFHYRVSHGISTLVTILDTSFSGSKARCGTGHETRKRGTTSSWANSPAILAFLQKGGQGRKLFYFCDFFCRTHFCVRREAND